MSSELQTEKKAFDPTMSFSFFGSWYETLERLKESQGVEVAYNLFEAIANYSRYYDAPNFEDGSIAKIFWPMIQREIDLSLKRRGANFTSEEAEERRQQIIAAYLENSSLSIREIAERTGISKSAVGRILQKLKDTAVEIATEREGEIEGEREEEKEVDTTGLGRDRAVGQSDSDGLIAETEEGTMWLDDLSDEDKALLGNPDPLPF